MESSVEYLTDDSQDQAVKDNLTNLQEESLKILLLATSVFAFVWLIWNTLKIIEYSFTLSAWISILLSFLTLYTSYRVSRSHLYGGTILFVAGLLLSIGVGVFDSTRQGPIYLFIIPIVFASVLLHQKGTLWVTAAAVFLISLIRLFRSEHSISLYREGFSFPTLYQAVKEAFSIDFFISATVLILVALALWLSSRNLFVALEWTYHGYQRARENEQIARERQAELRQTLKALDVAMYRFERANYMYALARDKAEDARRQKQQFLQNISHELRTPLDIIVGFIELMAQSPETYGNQLPEKYLRDISIIYRNATHLRALVNDVLDLSRIEAAKMTIFQEEVDPTILLEETINTCRSLIEARGLSLEIQIEDGLPRIWADPVRIRQVLFNLINNAIRFTPQGTITLAVARADQRVAFSVADTGAGIPAKDKSRIFEEFEQVDGSTRRRHEGAGLGLAISKRFIELHGGKIYVESEEGNGSKFTFLLPVSQIEREVIAHSEGGDEDYLANFENSETPVMVVVTSSPAAVVFLTRAIHGCRIVSVQNLDHAYRVIELIVPQAVLIDKNSCSELVEEFSLSVNLLRIPIIKCPLPEEDRRPGGDFNVNGYLVKPISRQSVIDVLRAMDCDVENILVIDDDRDLLRLITRILESDKEHHYSISSASNGREGLVMMSQKRPDLILLDLNLNRSDEFQVVERIRSTPEWEDICIVLMVAQEEMDNDKSLAGSFEVTRVGGLGLNEILRWIEYTLETTAPETHFALGEASAELTNHTLTG